MSEEEAKLIKSEYRDCPLYTAVDRFAKDVAGIEGLPAEHPSFLFYHAVYAIDDIKCIGNTERRLEKCRDLKNEVLHYLKHNKYYNQNKLAAEIIYCVRYSLEALSLMGCLKEIRIMSKHINELIPDKKTNEEIRVIARKYFVCEKLVEWIKSYYDGRDFISETITSKVNEMRKANPPKEDVIKKIGKGNRNSELFSNMELKEKMKNELLERFAEKNLSITGIIVKGKSKSLDCLVDFYNYMKMSGIIQNYNNPCGYLRFLKKSGFSFTTTDDNVVKKLRKAM